MTFTAASGPARYESDTEHIERTTAHVIAKIS